VEVYPKGKGSRFSAGKAFKVLNIKDPRF